MINSEIKSIYKPETIGMVTNETTQIENTRSKNQYGTEEFDLEYYHLFQQRRLICEAKACNLIATEKMKIPIGNYGEQIFFFCKNCIEKFKVTK